MKRRLLIVSALLYLLAIIGGSVSPRIESWWRNRNVDPGQLEVRKLVDLYEAEQYDQVLNEIDKVKDDNQFKNYRPQILYVQWVIDRRSRRDKDAKAIKVEFLRIYPTNPLAGDMYFADAVELLANGDCTAAEKKLAMIEHNYAKTAIAIEAKKIQLNLDATSLDGTEPSTSVDHE